MNDGTDLDLAEPLEVTLPDSGRALNLRFLRGSDEAVVMKKAERLKMTSNDDTDQSSKVRIAHQITHIDGMQVPVLEREMLVAKWTALDIATIRTRIDDAEPTIDTTLYPVCKFCGGDSEVEMPMTADFFRPTIRGPRNAAG